MVKEKKIHPYIDYKTANFLTRLFDFINDANRMRVNMLTELDDMSNSVAVMQKQIREMKEAFTPLETPATHCAFLEHDIGALRAIAWEAGLTETLFEKLNDRMFRHRFTGLGGEPVGEPVQEEEIRDRFNV